MNSHSLLLLILKRAIVFHPAARDSISKKCIHSYFSVCSLCCCIDCPSGLITQPNVTFLVGVPTNRVSIFGIGILLSGHFDLSQTVAGQC
jgi:hypothetical protein